MLTLTFNESAADVFVRAASTMVFAELERIGCATVPLGELTESPQYGFTASAAKEGGGPRYVRITDLQHGAIDWSSVPRCECPEPSRYWLRRGDLLFARTGATTGKTHLIDVTPEDAVFASYLIRLRPRRPEEAGYLYAFFQSDLFWAQVLDQKAGSAQANVNGEKLASIQIPLPEHRTATMIGDFVHAARQRQEGLDVSYPPLPGPLQRLRQLVHKMEAVSARILEARGILQRAEIETMKLEAAEIRRLFTVKPGGKWADAKLGDFILDDCYGTSEKTTDDPTGVPILRMGNIQNGELTVGALKYLHIRPSERAKLILREGDLLVNRTNSADLVGKCAVFGLEGDFGFASYLIRLRLDLMKADPYLVSAYINSPHGREYMFRERKQMTGQANVNARKLRALPVALPPLAARGRNEANSETAKPPQSNQ